MRTDRELNSPQNMKRGNLDIGFTDGTVDVKLNASARAKLGGFIFTVAMLAIGNAALLFIPGKQTDQSMWRDILTAKNPFDLIAPLLVITFFTTFLAWVGFRWAAAAWPSDEHFHCDPTTVTFARVPYLDLKNRKWKKTSFALAKVSSIRFGAYASAKGGTVYGLRFSVGRKGYKILPGLEGPEAQKILMVLQRLGCDVLLDDKLQKRVDQAVANRYGEHPLIS